MSDARRTRRGPRRSTYLSRLPFLSSRWIFAAIFCTFGSIGFIVDLMNMPMTSPRGSVLVLVAMSGIIACFAAAIASRGPRWIPMAVLASALLAVFQRWVLPAWFGPVVRATSVDALASQATFDALGCMLSLVFGYMLYIAFISRQGTKQLRLDAEFALAREIHAALVPPIAARTARLETWGRSDPSTEVGGDLVDVVEDGDGTLAVVADVSGHGVSAGMLTAMTRSAIRTRVTSPWTMAELLAGIDHLMIGLGRPDRFVTAVCVRFDAAGTAEVGLAGHLPLLIVRASSGTIERIDNQRPPLGAPFEAAFPVTRTHYAPGDLFALYTDGLTEARDTREREWGIDAIEAVLREHARAPLAEIAQAIFDRSRAHGASDDDQSLLLIRGR